MMRRRSAKRYSAPGDGNEGSTKGRQRTRVAFLLEGSESLAALVSPPVHLHQLRRGKRQERRRVSVSSASEAPSLFVCARVCSPAHIPPPPLRRACVLASRPQGSQRPEHLRRV